MGTSGDLNWFERAHADASGARRIAWRRNPRRMLSRLVQRRRSPERVEPRPASAADVDEVLRRLAELPIGYWTYGWEDADVRHLGPMAQDFWNAFGLGTTDRRMSTVDMNGVLIASVKALLHRVEALEAEAARRVEPDQ